MISQSIQRYLSLLRHCPLCGVSHIEVTWLCPDCHCQFASRVGLHKRVIHKNIEHYYLVPWFPGDESLGRAVYSLKGGRFKNVFSWLTDLMVQTSQISSPQGLFYPSQGLKDHAYQLASQLALRLPNVHPQPLYKVQGGNQARKSKAQRSHIQFMKTSWQGQRALLVDDVVTSGATAKACYRALNQPYKMTVWSLFYRKNL